MKKRSIRQSQLLHPYGPGAIIDLGQESFVMLDTEYNRANWQNSRKINLPRLSQRLQVKYFQVPPDNSVNQKSSLLVHRFPKWLFCPICRKMKKWGRDDEVLLKQNKLDAPECSDPACNGSLLVPMRYVAACKNGHLEDVDWVRLAHHKSNKSCNFTNPELKFISNGSGASFASLEIVCMKNGCGAKADFGDLQKPFFAKKIGQSCRGKQPWQSYKQRVECSETLRILLRSETAVHFSYTQSALDLGHDQNSSKNELAEFLLDQFKGLFNGPDLKIDLILTVVKGPISKEFGQKYDEEAIKLSVNQILNHSDNNLIEDNPELEEWKVLSKPTAGSNKALQVRGSGWNKIENKGSLHELFEDIFLIDRLREVRAFLSFSRVDPQNTREGNSILANGKANSADSRPDWLPAIEVFGEGIFFKLSNTALNKWENTNKNAFKDRQRKIIEKLSDQESWVSSRYGSLLENLPRFILVHTLSHALMRQLSFSCGYNLASIREKLFVFEDKAGILLYTAQGDSEGSLGGLVRQGEMDLSSKLITQAVERLMWCSNDPICSEMPENGLEGLNKSACHACVIVPETSCTHLNTFLDRNLVITAGRDKDDIKGFFDSIFGV